jgi:hypothetical protein
MTLQCLGHHVLCMASIGFHPSSSSLVLTSLPPQNKSTPLLFLKLGSKRQKGGGELRLRLLSLSITRIRKVGRGEQNNAARSESMRVQFLPLFTFSSPRLGCHPPSNLHGSPGQHAIEASARFMGVSLMVYMAYDIFHGTMSSDRWKQLFQTTYPGLQRTRHIGHMSLLDDEQ